MEEKWQPVMLVLKDGRLVCDKCGSLAVFIIVEKEPVEEGKSDATYADAYEGATIEPLCQECFTKWQENKE